VRKAHRVWSGIAAGVFCLVAATDLAGCAAPSAGTVASSSSLPATPTATPTSAPLAGAAAAPPPASAGARPPARVVEVIDGDTFRLASGDEVRVLGIDSCEAVTPGGQRATAAARSRLLAAPVTLTAEPGVDRDPYDRLLRYVTVGGADFAAAMVAADHTAIYTSGTNDASPAVRTALRRLDADGRVCGSAATTTTTTATPEPDPDVDRPRVPRPAVPRVAERESTGGGGTAYYPNCAAARAAGAAPIRAGQPGYRPALDRDRDGTACDT